MSRNYEIFEKSLRGDLVLVEKAATLEQAKTRFFFLTMLSGREYLVWDSVRRCSVIENLFKNVGAMFRMARHPLLVQ